MVVFVYPGQGSQKVGMGKVLYETYAEAREVFQEIDDVLGVNLSKICFSGSEDDLTDTINAQPALYAVSMALDHVLHKHYGFDFRENVRFVAGHSLGEFTALGCAGVFTRAEGARLLRVRGNAMARAVAPGSGGMTAILGLGLEDVTEICRTASNAGICVIANNNCAGQIVISGTLPALRIAGDCAKEKGATRVIPLRVSGPFHSPLMQSAADAMAEALADVTLVSPCVPVVANVTARPTVNVDEIRQNLIKQVTEQVCWLPSMEFICAHNLRVVEVGSGRVLTGLMGRINRDIETCNLETPEDLDAFMKTVAQKHMNKNGA